MYTQKNRVYVLEEAPLFEKHHINLIIEYSVVLLKASDIQTVQDQNSHKLLLQIKHLEVSG